MIAVLNVSFQSRPHVEPLGSEQIVDYFSNKGYETTLLTSSMYGSFSDEDLIRVLRAEMIIFAGINNVRDILDQFYDKRDVLAMRLKALGYDGPIVVMGHLASLQPQKTLDDCEAIDAIIVGDTDVAARYLDTLLMKKLPIKGVYRPERINSNNWIENGLTLTTYKRPYLDELCRIHPRKKLCAVIESSRGCSHGLCTFCSTAALQKACNRPQYVFKPVNEVVKEISYIFQTFGINKFIVEDDFASSPDLYGYERLLEFSKLIDNLSFPIEFSLVMRADCLMPSTESVFQRLRDSGLSLLYLGIESFCEADLRLYGKQIKFENMIQGIDIAQKLGYKMDVSEKYRLKPGLMPFHPYTDLTNILEQTDYLKKYSITSVKMIAEVELYPGTPLYQKAQNDRLLAPGTRSGFNYQSERTFLFHHYAKDLLKSFHKLRKRIRNIEKTTGGFDIQVAELNQIRQIRGDLENLFEKAYCDLLMCCIEGNSENIIQEMTENAKTKIFKYIDECRAWQVTDEVWHNTIIELRNWYSNIDDKTDPLFFRPCYFPVVH